MEICICEKCLHALQNKSFILYMFYENICRIYAQGDEMEVLYKNIDETHDNTSNHYSVALEELGYILSCDVKHKEFVNIKPVGKFRIDGSFLCCTGKHFAEKSYGCYD